MYVICIHTYIHFKNVCMHIYIYIDEKGHTKNVSVHIKMRKDNHMFGARQMCMASFPTVVSVHPVTISGITQNAAKNGPQVGLSELQGGLEPAVLFQLGWTLAHTVEANVNWRHRKRVQPYHLDVNPFLICCFSFNSERLLEGFCLAGLVSAAEGHLFKRVLRAKKRPAAAKARKTPKPGSAVARVFLLAAGIRPPWSRRSRGERRRSRSFRKRSFGPRAGPPGTSTSRRRSCGPASCIQASPRTPRKLAGRPSRKKRFHSEAGLLIFGEAAACTRLYQPGAARTRDFGSARGEGLGFCQRPPSPLQSLSAQLCCQRHFGSAAQRGPSSAAQARPALSLCGLLSRHQPGRDQDYT